MRPLVESNKEFNHAVAALAAAVMAPGSWQPVYRTNVDSVDQRQTLSGPEEQVRQKFRGILKECVTQLDQTQGDTKALAQQMLPKLQDLIATMQAALKAEKEAIKPESQAEQKSLIAPPVGLLKANGDVVQPSVLLKANGDVVHPSVLLKANGDVVYPSVLLKANGDVVHPSVLRNANGNVIQPSALLNAYGDGNQSILCIPHAGGHLIQISNASPVERGAFVNERGAFVKEMKAVGKEMKAVGKEIRACGEAISNTLAIF